MFRAIGVVLILWYLSHQFSQSYHALDRALTATLETVEVAAETSREHLK